MATFPAPASIVVGDVVRGDEVMITWSPVPGAVLYVLQRSINGVAFGTNNEDTINNTADTYTVDTAGENWNTVQYRVRATGRNENGSAFVDSDWTVSDIKTVQEVTPPEPSVSARLEQLQNSNGEIVYPQTIVEGVFRQSDGKTLAELLEASSGGVTMDQVNAAIQDAVLDSWGASY